jgi:NADH-quinone oxidoreductase subunit N
MTPNDLIALVPIIIIAAAAVLTMLCIAVYRCHGLTFALTAIGLTLSFASLFFSYYLVPHRATSLLVFDGYSFFFIGLILPASLSVCIFAYGYLSLQIENSEEFYVLLLSAVLGSMVLTTSSHFVSFFLGLEILSVSLYAMIAYLRNSNTGIEAGIKYLILASVSVAFMLFGIALIYAETGTLGFIGIAERTLSTQMNNLLLLGTVLFIVGLGFKLAVVPFHVWTPDVYEGASSPVTAFIATVSKAAVFAFLLRYFSAIGQSQSGPLFLIFTVIAVASMLIGNFLALLQDNVKRILAYSSIAHMGYLLVAFLSSGPYVLASVTFYFTAYFVTTLGAFGIIAILSDAGGEPDRIEDYRGLVWRRPWLGAVFTLILFSLAGIPLTAGFIGKFYVLAAGANSALWLLVIVLVTSSAIGLFYYLRVIVALYSRPPEEASRIAKVRVAASGGIVLGTLSAVLLGLGVYPSALIRLIQFVTGGRA